MSWLAHKDVETDYHSPNTQMYTRETKIYIKLQKLNSIKKFILASWKFVAVYPIVHQQLCEISSEDGDLSMMRR